MRSRNVNGDGRGRFRDGENMEPFYMKKKAEIKGKIFYRKMILHTHTHIYT